jgi:hypothetical protein
MSMLNNDQTDRHQEYPRIELVDPQNNLSSADVERPKPDIKRDSQADNSDTSPEPHVENDLSEVSSLIRAVLSRSKSDMREEWLAHHTSQQREKLKARPMLAKDKKKLRYRGHILAWDRGTIPVHWTDIMAILEQMYRDIHEDSKSTSHTEVYALEETIAALSGSTYPEENIWIEPIRNGCQVRVLRAEEGAGRYRKVILSGTQRAISLARAKIKQTQERQDRVAIQAPCFPIFPAMFTAAMQHPGQIPLFRGVWDDPTPRYKVPNLRQISNRPITSVREFLYCIEDLTLADLSTRPRPPEEAYTYCDRVKSVILDLFRRESNRRYFSTAALNLALSFLERNEFLDSVRTVLSSAEGVASTETYNILLQSTAERQDLRFFRHILKSMKRNRIRSDGRTWVSFLQCLISPGPKREVMFRMSELGYLKDRKTQIGVLQYNIGIILDSHLSSGKDFPSFIKTVMEDYGPAAISTHLLNSMLKEAAARRDIDLRDQIIDCFKQRELSFDRWTFRTLLEPFKLIYSTVMFISRHMRPENYRFLEHDTYEKLFLLAHNSQAYNACRVLWRYACLEGKTTPHMRQIVRSSLAGEILGKRRFPKKVAFQNQVGKVVIGLDYHQHGIEPLGMTPQMVPALFQDNPLQFLIEKEASEGELQWNLANHLVRDDVYGGVKYKPLEPLELMLDAAVRIDREERQQMSPLIDILKNAIHVPVTTKRRIDADISRPDSN